MVLIDGDGSFLMNIQELACMKIEKINAKILILNTQHLGMVVQWEDRFYGSVYTPSCCIADPAVARLILARWERRADPGLRLRAAQEWPEYAACCRALPGWEFLVDAALAGMLEDLAGGDEGGECDGAASSHLDNK